MNKTTLTYIILLSMIFISLGIGMYIFDMNTTKEGLNGINKQKIGDLLMDEHGNQVRFKEYNSIVIPQVSAVNSSSVVTAVTPNIALDSNGYPLYDSNNNTYLNNNIQNIGDLLKDAYNKVITDKNTQFTVTTVNGNSNNGIVTGVTPKIQLTTSGYPSRDRNGRFIYGNKSDNTQQLPYVDTQFHPSEQQIIDDNDYKDLKSGYIYVNDQCGNRVLIPKSNVQGSITYYQPDVYRYGASTYVPNYEDSVYLSRTTGLSTTGVISNPTQMKGGICTYYKNFPSLLEEACQKMNTNTCASTSCCVLLGGSKCVSGDDQGPAIKSNYSDVYIPNRDYYYYQGKCYGNCLY